MALTHKDLEKLSYSELEAALAAKKQGEVDSLKQKLKEARLVVADLEAQVLKLTGKPTPTTTRAPRGSVRQSILKVLEDGVLTIDEIRKATGIDKISPTLANLKITKLIKQEGKRGPYSLVK